MPDVTHFKSDRMGNLDWAFSFQNLTCIKIVDTIGRVNWNKIPLNHLVKFILPVQHSSLHIYDKCLTEASKKTLKCISLGTPLDFHSDEDIDYVDMFPNISHLFLYGHRDNTANWSRNRLYSTKFPLVDQITYYHRDRGVTPVQMLLPLEIISNNIAIKKFKYNHAHSQGYLGIHSFSYLLAKKSLLQTLQDLKIVYHGDVTESEIKSFKDIGFDYNGAILKPYSEKRTLLFKKSTRPNINNNNKKSIQLPNEIIERIISMCWYSHDRVECVCNVDSLVDKYQKLYNQSFIFVPIVLSRFREQARKCQYHRYHYTPYSLTKDTMDIDSKWDLTRINKSLHQYLYNNLITSIKHFELSSSSDIMRLIPNINQIWISDQSLINYNNQSTLCNQISYFRCDNNISLSFLMKLSNIKTINILNATIDDLDSSTVIQFSTTLKKLLVPKELQLSQLSQQHHQQLETVSIPVDDNINQTLSLFSKLTTIYFTKDKNYKLSNNKTSIKFPKSVIKLITDSLGIQLYSILLNSNIHTVRFLSEINNLVYPFGNSKQKDLSQLDDIKSLNTIILPAHKAQRYPKHSTIGNPFRFSAYHINHYFIYQRDKEIK
ncbi:hypothetical protein DFA_03218 [Cavenderia fasciculata]|uniref:Uncharacterized protein n=1 Tax=Cavenderia fasciculata TaxID=261658 RepID=F4PGY8_CACFS|nr:uncharacterized protein DFA_03218 [Cavenderia fasciculata]EGG24972.1 hypothetical protein DFA_03218 [Cavenderia fasciculata]|eukprot:XP_004362823.1 hypothetical protein DFA_03218 [Cavenderia fasciculata]